MALTDVLDNFADQIKAISCTDKVPGRDFHQIDPADTDPDQTPGTVRGFSIRWRGSERAHEVEDMATRWSYHDIEVDFFYPRTYPLTTLYRIIVSDRNDLLKRLRDDTYWETGTIGLQDRDFSGDEVIESSPVTAIYRQRWRCLCSETE